MKVKVYNDDVKEYVEEYKGDIIRIPAKGFIIMDRGEAAGFMGQFTPIKIDPQSGEHTNLKKLRKEFIVDEIPGMKTTKLRGANDKYICMYDGKEFVNEKDLNNYIELNYSDKVMKDDKNETKTFSNRKKIVVTK